jgi:hypothetical protein
MVDLTRKRLMDRARVCAETCSTWHWTSPSTRSSRQRLCTESPTTTPKGFCMASKRVWPGRVRFLPANEAIRGFGACGKFVAVCRGLPGLCQPIVNGQIEAPPPPRSRHWQVADSCSTMRMRSNATGLARLGDGGAPTAAAAPCIELESDAALLPLRGFRSEAGADRALPDAWSSSIALAAQLRECPLMAHCRCWSGRRA